jgi:hypothetical protein
MNDKNLLTKSLAVVGTILIWFPILAPVLMAFAALFTRGRFLLDFLIPAEIFPVPLAGALLLLWAGYRAHSRWKLIAWTLGISVALLVGSQALAVVTGLASGATEPSGFWFILVMTVFIGFLVALIAVAVEGILLLRDLFRKPQLPA